MEGIHFNPQTNNLQRVKSDKKQPPAVDKSVTEKMFAFNLYGYRGEFKGEKLESSPIKFPFQSELGR